MAAETEISVREDEVIMAIDLNDHNALGCAYLSVAERRLFLLGNATNPLDEEFERLITMIRPTTILSSARTSERLTLYLENETKKIYQGACMRFQVIFVTYRWINHIMRLI